MVLVVMFLCDQSYASHGRDFLLGATILNPSVAIPGIPFNNACCAMFFVLDCGCVVCCLALCGNSSERAGKVGNFSFSLLLKIENMGPGSLFYYFIIWVVSTLKCFL